MSAVPSLAVLPARSVSPTKAICHSEGWSGCSQASSILIGNHAWGVQESWFGAEAPLKEQCRLGHSGARFRRLRHRCRPAERRSPDRQFSSPPRAVRLLLTMHGADAMPAIGIRGVVSLTRLDACTGKVVQRRSADTISRSPSVRGQMPPTSAKPRRRPEEGTKSVTPR